MKAEPVIFAQLSDKPGLFACLTYHEEPPLMPHDEWIKLLLADEPIPEAPEALFDYSEVSSIANHSDLPVLLSDDAKQVAEHAFYSGADPLMTAKVRAYRGHQAMLDYTEFQNYAPMHPTYGNMPEEQLKHVGAQGV